MFVIVDGLVLWNGGGNSLCQA